MLLAERPLLALFHNKSTVCDLVRSAGGALLVAFDETSPALTQVSAIAEALERLLRCPDAAKPTNLTALAPYLADAIAGRFATVLERVAVEGPRGLGP